MTNARSRALVALVALVAVPAAVCAAAKPFAGPGGGGWDHSVAQQAPAADVQRSQETWKKRDGEYVTYLADSGLSYDDAVASVKKNISDNGIKTTADTDRNCTGQRAHEFEMTFGTTIAHQIVIDDAPGLTKITYVRPSATPASADVTTALTTYCGS